jgi:DNA modification methylase
MSYEPSIFEGDCDKILLELPKMASQLLPLHLTFMDPPFNQNKDYDNHNDNLPPQEYWAWMTRICRQVYELTDEGGAMYFMQREKNTSFMLKALVDAGWILQNIIIWKKKTSAVPQVYRYGKQYQVIAFAAKGDKPRLFNRLRIDLPLEPGQKEPRENGVYVTDVWDDIRELTSGFFAGDEAIRDKETSKRAHEQQAPVALLLRIILSSTQAGDHVLDPFSGTGTTNIVASQLCRHSIGIEKSPANCALIHKRLAEFRKSDDVKRYYPYYRFTPNLESIWQAKMAPKKRTLDKYMP